MWLGRLSSMCRKELSRALSRSGVAMRWKLLVATAYWLLEGQCELILVFRRSLFVETCHFHSEEADRFWRVELAQKVERDRGDDVLVVGRAADGGRAGVGREVVQADLDADVAPALVLLHEALDEL